MNPWTANLRALAKGCSRDVQALLTEAQTSGEWVGRKEKNNHIRLHHRDGGAVVVPATTAQPRSVKNTRSHIRRIEKGCK